MTQVTTTSPRSTSSPTSKRKTSLPKSPKNESPKKTKAENHLEQLINYGTSIVTDSADFNLLKKYKSDDATTNPSLILNSIKQEEYSHILEEAINNVRATLKEGDKLDVDDIVDEICVLFGVEVLKLIDGKVSTEIAADLSYDTEASVERALSIIKRYEAKGISKDRILIKIASTFEGIQACKILQSDKHNINCNMTLLFSLVQARAAAEANAYLISPFVGRIRDWHLANNRSIFNEDGSIAGEKDPGVVSVKNIYNYYKEYNYQTIVMGASFRNVDEIINLAGCDKLTISPKLLQELIANESPIERALSPIENIKSRDSIIPVDKAIFDKEMAEDQMATDKLKTGVDAFSADLEKLKDLIREKL